MDTRLGFIGLGTMGAYMAANLVRAGRDVTVWNRTPERADDVVALGATWAPSPSEVARRCDVLVLCVTDSPQVEAVLFGEDGAAGGLAAGSLVIDCSTINPVNAVAIGDRLKAQGVGFIDAPVSGGSEGARLATLTIMVGGSEGDVERARGVLSLLGTTITHLGDVGAGQWTKAVNQVIISGTYLAVAEGVTLGLKAGLDMEKVVAALGGGVAGSWILTNRSGRMIDNDYPLGFKISLHRKDLGIVLDLAKGLGVELPVTSLAAEFEDELIEQGFGNDDNSALARCIRTRSGLV
jgi:3-hydroxyisobutyrate dehydrogenase